MLKVRDNTNNVNDNQNNEEKKKKSRGLVAIIIILIIIIILLLLRSCSGPATNPNNPVVDNPNNDNKPGIVFDDNAQEGGFVEKTEEEIIKELNEKVALSMINISMNPAPVFPDGKSAGNLRIMNNLVNNYPQMVTIVRSDTDEQIYQSKAIPVGSRIEEAKLDVDLPAGTYECVAYFDNLDPETGNSLGRAGANIIITIQN